MLVTLRAIILLSLFFFKSLFVHLFLSIMLCRIKLEYAKTRTNYNFAKKIEIMNTLVLLLKPSFFARS